MYGLLPRLPRQAWFILGGDALSALGTGLTLPFFVVYLHHMRGIELALAGPTLSVIAVAGLAGNPVGGLLADRFGARLTAAAGLALAATGTAGMAGVQLAWHGFLTAGVYGLGIAVAAPSLQSLLGTSVPADQRSQIFAVRHGVLNIGFSAGGLLAASVVSFSSPRSFVTLYLLDAGTFLLFAVLIARSSRGGVRSGRPPAPAPTYPVATGYREILSDRLLLRIWAPVVVVVACGYALYYSAYPVYAAEAGGLDAAGLRLTFLANTCTVIFTQLLVLRLMRGRRRTRGFALCAALMAVAWTVVLLITPLGGGAAGMTGFMAALALFAVGETLMAPTVPAIVNDLAPDSARGRYNGAYSLAWTLGYIVGPAMAGVTLASGHGSMLFAGSALALCLVALHALRLERVLPASVNVIAAPGTGGAQRPTPNHDGWNDIGAARRKVTRDG